MRVTNDRKILRECPLCGGFVELDRDNPLLADAPLEDGSRGVTSERGPVDRLTTALCGCYVFRMDDNAIGRLMAAVLGVEADPDGPVAD
ncbi:MAG: hypothetical protein ACYC33_08630 [Thermoleophilia bacterium]